MTIDIDPRDPKFLAFWTKCIREASNLSQDALAVASGVDVRTIQRIESGKYNISVTTRRALARGLGYEDVDFFDRPEFYSELNSIFDVVRKSNEEKAQQQFPNHVRISVNRAMNGEALARIAYDSSAYLFNADDDISDEAKETAAQIFDFLRDLGDISDDISFSDKRRYYQPLQELIIDLHSSGAACYSSYRTVDASLLIKPSANPFTIVIGYLTIVREGKVLTDIFVPKGIN